MSQSGAFEQRIAGAVLGEKRLDLAPQFGIGIAGETEEPGATFRRLLQRGMKQLLHAGPAIGPGGRLRHGSSRASATPWTGSSRAVRFAETRPAPRLCLPR